MSSDSDRTKKSLSLFIRKVLGCFIISSVDYLGAFSCKVVAQNSDGSLELVPDDVRLSPYSSVPIRYGIPGVAAIVANGGRALLQFEGGDPTKRYCTIWESANVTSLTITTSTVLKLGGSGASHPLIYGDDFSSVGGAFDTLVKAIGTAVGGIPGGAAAATAVNAALLVYQTAVLAKLSSISKTV
jgi:hypothetical protein